MDPLQWMGAVRMTVQTADKNGTITPISSSSINMWSSKKLHICKKQIHYWGILMLNCCFWPKYHSISHNVYFSKKVLLLVSPRIKIYWHTCLEPVWAVFTCKQCLHRSLFFISCLNSHSDGTHSLQRIHCWCLIYILDGLRLSTFSINAIHCTLPAGWVPRPIFIKTLQRLVCTLNSFIWIKAGDKRQTFCLSAFFSVTLRQCSSEDQPLQCLSTTFIFEWTIPLSVPVRCLQICIYGIIKI